MRAFIAFTSELLAIQESSDVAIRPAESRQRTSEDMKGDDDNNVDVNDKVQTLLFCITIDNASLMLFLANWGANIRLW